jgi:PAS domain-containing protein
MGSPPDERARQAAELIRLNQLLVTEVRERRLAEAAQRASEERLALALEVSHLGAWFLDPRDHTVYRTLLHDQIFGYDALLPRWTYEIFLDYVLPEDREAVNRSFRAATSAHASWDVECRIRRPDGEVRGSGSGAVTGAGRPTARHE